MPIVSRTLTMLANREDIAPGWKRWRADGADARGTRWVLGPFGGTLADAEAKRDTAWPQQELEDHDELFGFGLIEQGMDPADYVPEDMSLNEWRERVVRRWWNTTIEEDSKFVCLVAAYITTFTAQQISSILGVTVGKANKGLARAVDLRDNVCPAMQAADAEAEDA